MVRAGDLLNPRVLTDVTGEFNRLVMKFKVESAAGSEEMYEKCF